MVNKKPVTGMVAFIMVLLTMPLGHSAMILMENWLGHAYVFEAAILLGIFGAVLVIVGYKIKNDSTATIFGLFGGLAIWTGWIEFAYVYYATRYRIQPLMENGEIVTKPEYLLLPSSIGFIVMLILFYLFNKFTKCNFFVWWQKKLNINRSKSVKIDNRSSAVITAFEIITILWTFYLVLLFSYDSAFFGDKHFVTYFVAFGSLLWSVYLFLKLLKINKFDYAIRYAIPTAIIFWNFVEVLGRWGFFKEIWIHPLEYWLEIALITVVLVVLVIITLIEGRKNEEMVK